MSKPVILCIDDDKTILESLKEQLQQGFQGKYSIETSEDGQEALELFDELKEELSELVVIICDHIMPGLKGDELLKRFHTLTPKTIKIMLTGQADSEAVGNAVNYAQLYRYISKPWDRDDLVLTVSEGIRRYFTDKQLEAKNKSMEEMNLLLQEKLEVIKERETELEKHRDHLEEMVRERTVELQEINKHLKKEIIERERIEEQLRILATTDPLTGTCNRRHFIDLGKNELARTLAPEMEISVLVIDVDHLKRINDSYGYAAGDEVIKKMAAACQSKLRERDLFGRLAGGEFSAILPGTDTEGAIEIAEVIRREIVQPCMIPQYSDLHFTVSIGIATSGSDDETLDSLLNLADGALSRAKSSGRNRVVAT